MIKINFIIALFFLLANFLISPAFPYDEEEDYRVQAAGGASGGLISGLADWTTEDNNKRFAMQMQEREHKMEMERIAFQHQLQTQGTQSETPIFLTPSQLQDQNSRNGIKT